MCLIMQLKQQTQFNLLIILQQRFHLKVKDMTEIFKQISFFKQWKKVHINQTLLSTIIYSLQCLA